MILVNSHLFKILKPLKPSPILMSAMYGFNYVLQVELPGCKGIWTVYHKNARGMDSSKRGDDDDDEYHAYLIISLENRTMVVTSLYSLNSDFHFFYLIHQGISNFCSGTIFPC